LFSGVPEDSEDDTVMEQDSADALYSTVESLMHAMQTECEEAQQNAAHRMIQILTPWTIRRWSESKLANGKPLVQILMENAHLVELEWTEDDPAKLKALMER
jgi:hypothetical protein